MFQFTLSRASANVHIHSSHMQRRKLRNLKSKPTLKYDSWSSAANKHSRNDSAASIDLCLQKRESVTGLFENRVGGIMEEPHGGHAFRDAQVVQVRQKGDGVEREEVLC